jgi:hypothetical protein
MRGSYDEFEIDQAKSGVASRCKKCAGGVFPLGLGCAFEQGSVGVLEHEEAAGKVGVGGEAEFFFRVGHNSGKAEN